MSGEQVLSRESSISIKGISAVAIMLGHLGKITGFWFLYPFWKSALLFVGVFFMLSGYGLMYNYSNSSEYLNHFLKKRIVSILFPAYVVYILFGCIEAIITPGGGQSVQSIIQYIFLKEFYKRTNWFVFEIVFLYILFWIIYKFFSLKIASVIMSIVMVLWIIAGFYCHIDKAWYDSSLCFLVGILYARHEEKWNEWMQKSYLLKNISFLIICGGCFGVFLALGNNSFIGHPVLKNVAACSFCMWVLSILQKIDLKNRLFQWLGVYSYEIFLLHLIWMQLIEGYALSPWYYMFFVILLTLISAVFVKKMIIYALHGKKKRR